MILPLVPFLAGVSALFLPADTAYVLNSGEGDRPETGPNAIPNPQSQILWGGYPATAGILHLAVQAQGAGTGVSYWLRVTGPGLNKDVADNGSVSIKQPGWYRFLLSAKAPFGQPLGKIEGLALDGPAADGALFNLKSRRNCASVHIGYPLPPGTQAEWFYNEVKAKTDPLYTYYMACGFSRGYFGMQVNSPTERRVIFSIWDSGNEAVDRSKVSDENRVRLLGKGEGVVADSFGNEGTGGHSHLVTSWKTNTVQRFLVHAQPDGSGTIYTGYYYSPERSAWTLVASFRAPKDGGLLRGLYSFNENFWGDNGYLERKAEFGPAWIRTTDEQWLQLTTGRFTHDVTGGKDRFDYDLTSAGTHFVLQNGGFTGASPKLGTLVTVRPSGKPPTIDINMLPKPQRLLTASGRDALDKRLLREKEEHDDGQGEDRRGRHQLGEEAAVVRHELLQAIGERVLGWVVDVE
jgi:hypothetical protein